MARRTEPTARRPGTLSSAGARRPGHLVAGVRVVIDPTVLLVAPFVALSFWDRFHRVENESVAVVLALAATLAVAVSILLHELAHARTARVLGLEIEDVTLHVFGGATRLRSEARRPLDAFLLGAVGPWTSLTLGAGFALVAWACTPGLPALAELAGPLAWFNLLLGVFNLLPGAPLDGGRVLAAVVWRLSGDPVRAARVAAFTGQVLGGALAVAGAAEAVLTTGGFLSGLWLVIIGWFLLRAAQGERTLALVRSQLGALRAGDIASTAVSVPSGAALRLVHALCLYPTDFVAVITPHGEVIGVVTLADTTRLGPTQASALRVDDIMTPLADLAVIDAEAPAIELLQMIGPRPVRVVRDGRPPSLVGASDVAAALRTSGMRHERARNRSDVPRRAPLGTAARALASGLLGASLAAMTAAALVVPLPVLDIAPGPTLRVGAIVHTGGPERRPPGSFLLTSVTLASPSLVGTIGALVNGEHDVSFGETGTPAGISPDDYVAYERSVFRDSVRIAAAVAWRAAGYPVSVRHLGAVVLSVTPGGPADGVLQPGDVIVAVDGRRVAGAAAVEAEVAGAFNGLAVDLERVRGSEHQHVLVVPRTSSLTGAPVLGVALQDAAPVVGLPFTVRTSAVALGGPSGGLMTALGIYARATGRDLAAGRTVAGTGTLDVHGVVGEVGGVGQKVISAARAGAHVFLAPVANAAAAREAAAGRKITVIAVSSFDGARRALAALGPR